MYQLSKMSRNDMIKVLTHFDSLLTNVYNIDLQILRIKGSMSKYAKNVKNKKGTNGSILRFVLNLLVPLTIVVSLAIYACFLPIHLDDSLEEIIESIAEKFAENKAVLLKLIIFDAILCVLIFLSFAIKKKSDKKLLANNHSTIEASVRLNECFEIRDKAQKACDEFISEYNIPRSLYGRDSVRHVVKLLREYHDISLKDAIDDYWRIEEASRAREERAQQLQTIEAIRRDNARYSAQRSEEHRRIEQTIRDVHYRF